MFASTFFFSQLFSAESADVFQYASKIRQNIEEYLTPSYMKSQFDALNVIGAHVDKILWVRSNWNSFNWNVEKVIA